MEVKLPRLLGDDRVEIRLTASGGTHVLDEDSVNRLLKDLIEARSLLAAKRDVPVALPSLEAFRDEMERDQRRMVKLAASFLELGAYKDAAECAMRADNCTWMIGRIPRQPS